MDTYARFAAIVAVMAGFCVTCASAAPAAAPALIATWTEIPNPNYAPPSGPYARAWTEMTWDSLRREIVIFGGNGPHLYDNDIWSLNASTSTWTNLAPYTFCPGNDGFTQPNGTDDTAFKYDPYNNLYWVFGAASGYRCVGDAPLRTAGSGSGPDTIVDAALTGTVDDYYAQWTAVTDDGEAEVLHYSSATKTLTLASEIPTMAMGKAYRLVATSTAGVWYFDPATVKWVGQDTPVGNTGPTPTLVRVAPGVAYSDADRAFALFAGLGAGVDKQVWKLDVTTKLWTQLPLPATTPPHLRELLNAFVYDKANDVFVLFGGICSYDEVCPDGTLNGDTWVYRLSTNTWQKMNPASPPPARMKHLMAYDEANGVIVLFGGSLADGQLTNDTWYYHYPSNTWTKVSPSVSPSARYLSQIAYDPVAKRSVVFGGADPSLLADIWSLTLSGGGGSSLTVDLTAPASGSSFEAPATIGLTATASGAGSNVTKLQFFAGTAKIGEDASSPYSMTWQVGVPGTYSLTAVATDNLGATATSAAVSVNVTDTTAPSVAMTSPGSGASLSGTISLAANASDNVGIASVQFLLDGAALGSEITAAPYAADWNTTTATNGTHTLSARARDAAGNQSTSTPIGVTVSNNADSTPPTVTSTSPAAGAKNVNRSTTIVVSFSEAMNPATIDVTTFMLRNASNVLVPSTVAYSSSTRRATLNPTGQLAAKTTYTVTVRGGTVEPRVKDLAGNALAADQVWSFTTK